MIKIPQSWYLLIWKMIDSDSQLEVGLDAELKPVALRTMVDKNPLSVDILRTKVKNTCSRSITYTPFIDTYFMGSWYQMSTVLTSLSAR